LANIVTQTTVSIKERKDKIFNPATTYIVATYSTYIMSNTNNTFRKAGTIMLEMAPTLSEEEIMPTASWNTDHALHYVVCAARMVALQHWWSEFIAQKDRRRLHQCKLKETK
jgi:hypothetical protein